MQLPGYLRPTLRSLLDIALADERFASLASEIGPGEAVDLRASGPIRPYLLAALLDSDEALGSKPALVVAADDVGARDLARALGAYLAPRRVRYYPSRGTGYASHLAPPPHLVGLRIGALDALTGERADREPPVVVASAVALAEAVPDASMRPGGFALHKGEEVDLGDVSELLVEAGYERTEQVEDRGQFSIRGDILDVFGATEDRPARLELFGDEIESIRWFSTFTQRSLDETEVLELDPAAELALEHRELAEIATEEDERPDVASILPIDRFVAPLDLIGDDTAVVLAAAEEIPAALHDHWEDVTTAMHDADARHLYVDVADPLAERSVLNVRGAADEEDDEAFRAQSATSAARSIGEAESQLEKDLRSGYRIVVTFESRGEAERTRYNLNRVESHFLEGTPGEDASVRLAEAPLSDGFVSPELRLVVIPFRRLVHRRRAAAPTPGGRGPMATFADLRVGDYVVHEDHGIARFAGFETKTLAGVTRDYLELEYKGDDKVFAPTEQLTKITRYVGSGGEAPQLSALGSKRWDAVKARARRAARELAGELLNLYAERQARKGHVFEPDGEWQLELERSFPYRETADQIDAIEAVKADMESDRPMDRLICGDVGYGKTEVALRAAHKAAAEGKQVMMLVPTTILAQQHLGTFRERLQISPLEIEMVSRLRKPAEVREALAKFADGRVDILIGTHRLLSRDVRAKDLGLVIVDEEQRFGVKQKELLRQLKLKVDVLSLSATPIPRTLQMSLAGLRDISVIETPPEGRRPVRTYVGPYDEELVGRAIQREVAREGQVFFLHNRIESLHDVAERLRAVCPGVRFAEAHGQMDEGELEDDDAQLPARRRRRARRDDDHRVRPRHPAGEHADRRARRPARAGSGVPDPRSRRAIEGARLRLHALPVGGGAQPVEAGQRLATLSDHTELGSGFAIAMRDLELRGAGDLLGDEQSGHVAAIGFELYVALLDEAVEQLRAEGAGETSAEAPVRLDLDVDAYLPADYVPFETAKIDIHRRIAATREPGRLRQLRDELRDRFGPIPEPVENLLTLQRARIDLAAAGARTAEVRGGRLSIVPLELDAATVGRLREEMPEAMFELRTRTLSRRVEDDPAARLESLLELTAALIKAWTKNAVAIEGVSA